MAGFEDRKKSHATQRSSDHDLAPVQRRVELVAPTPAPLAPAATPVQRLAFTQVQRQHQIAAAQPVLTASATLQRLAATVAPEQLSLQRQIDGLRAGLPAGAEQAALQRQTQRTQPPTVPAHFATAPAQRAGRVASSADYVGLYGYEAHTLERSTPSGYVPQGHWQAIQRRAAEGLTLSYGRSGGDAVQRQTEFAGQLARLQRQPAGGSVAQVVLQRLPQGERPAIQRALDEANATLQRQEAQDAQVEQLHALQRQLDQHQQQSSEAHVMQRIRARQGSGEPLPASVRRHMEQGLNTRLKGVRIHTDSEAHQLSKKAGATAFTSGKDIYFQRGQFDLNSRSGLELLGHELTHVKQQGESNVPAGIDGDMGKEQDAQQMGRQLAEGTLQRQAKATSRASRAPTIQRKREAGDGGGRASKPAPERPQHEAPAPRAERPEPKASAPKAEANTSAADAKAEQERQDQADAAREAAAESREAQAEQARRDAIQEGADVGISQAELHRPGPVEAAGTEGPTETGPTEQASDEMQPAGVEVAATEFGADAANLQHDESSEESQGPWGGLDGVAPQGWRGRAVGSGLGAVSPDGGLLQSLLRRQMGRAEAPMQASSGDLAIQRKASDKPRRSAAPTPKPKAKPSGPKPGATKPKGTSSGPKPRTTAPRAPTVPNTGARGRPGTTPSRIGAGTPTGNAAAQARQRALAATYLRDGANTNRGRAAPPNPKADLHVLLGSLNGVDPKTLNQLTRSLKQGLQAGRLTPADVQRMAQQAYTLQHYKAGDAQSILATTQRLRDSMVGGHEFARGVSDTYGPLWEGGKALIGRSDKLTAGQAWGGLGRDLLEKGIVAGTHPVSVMPGVGLVGPGPAYRTALDHQAAQVQGMVAPFVNDYKTGNWAHMAGLGVANGAIMGAGGLAGKGAGMGLKAAGAGIRTAGPAAAAELRYQAALTAWRLGAQDQRLAVPGFGASVERPPPPNRADFMARTAPGNTAASPKPVKPMSPPLAAANALTGQAKQNALAELLPGWNKAKPFVGQPATAANLPPGYLYAKIPLGNGKFDIRGYLPQSRPGDVPSFKMGADGTWKPTGLSVNKDTASVNSSFRLAQASEYNKNNPPLKLPGVKAATNNHHMTPDNVMRDSQLFQVAFEKGVTGPDRASGMINLATSPDNLSALRGKGHALSDITHNTQHPDTDALLGDQLRDYITELKHDNKLPTDLRLATPQQLKDAISGWDARLRDRFMHDPNSFPRRSDGTLATNDPLPSERQT